MNIERMQKINELAQQLVEKGVAEDLTEATKQAEEMINKGDTGISSVLGTEKKQSSESAPGSSQEEEEMKLQLRKLSFQVSEQSKVISELKSQFKGLLDEISRMKTSKPASQSHILEKSSDKPQTTLSKESTEKKPHARSGNYESEDVSIEKMFYSGPPKD